VLSPAHHPATETAWLSPGSPISIWLAFLLSTVAVTVAGFTWFSGRKLRSSTTELMESFDARIQDLELILHHRQRDVESIYADLQELGHRLDDALVQTAPWLVEADVRLSELTEVAEQLHQAIAQLEQAERHQGRLLRQILHVLAALREREPVVTVEPFVCASGVD
jgi:septal ring factor EnvC (AmiA/AmiB activator)